MSIDRAAEGPHEEHAGDDPLGGFGTYRENVLQVGDQFATGVGPVEHGAGSIAPTEVPAGERDGPSATVARELGRAPLTSLQDLAARHLIREAQVRPLAAPQEESAGATDRELATDHAIGVFEEPARTMPVKKDSAWRQPVTAVQEQDTSQILEFLRSGSAADIIAMVDAARRQDQATDTHQPDSSPVRESAANPHRADVAATDAESTAKTHEGESDVEVWIQKSLREMNERATAAMQDMAPPPDTGSTNRRQPAAPVETPRRHTLHEWDDLQPPAQPAAPDRRARQPHAAPQTDDTPRTNEPKPAEAKAAAPETAFEDEDIDDNTWTLRLLEDLHVYLFGVEGETEGVVQRLKQIPANLVDVYDRVMDKVDDWLDAKDRSRQEQIRHRQEVKAMLKKDLPGFWEDFPHTLLPGEIRRAEVALRKHELAHKGEIRKFPWR
jgi:hypothetical protein